MSSFKKAGSFDLDRHLITNLDFAPVLILEKSEDNKAILNGCNNQYGNITIEEND